MQQFAPLEELFKGSHFGQEIVAPCMRRYLSFKLSYRDLVAMMAERGIDLAHTTMRWVQHDTPEFEKRWKRFARPVGGSWRMDETYIKVRGTWVYLYRLLRKAMKNQRVPAKITLDAYAASHRAVAELKKDGELPKRARTSKYLNNGIEQDHRRVKHRIRAIQFKIGKLGGSKATMPTFGRSQNCTRAVSTWTGTCGACATQST